MQRTAILGTQVCASTFEEALGWLDDQVVARRGTYMCPSNAYSLVLGHDDRDLRRRVNGAGYVMADGMPVVWALRTRGLQAQRVHGDDLMLAYLSRHPRRRHFLLGGETNQPNRVASAIRERFPAVTIAGVAATPIRPIPREVNDSILERIRACRADLVWVGMGTPAQDIWMSENATHIGRPAVGVGSAFDLLSGKTRAAPGWIKQSGLQWAFRLAQEPRRLALRYLRYNPRFLALLLAESARRNSSVDM